MGDKLFTQAPVLALILNVPATDVKNLLTKYDSQITECVKKRKVPNQHQTFRKSLKKIVVRNLTFIVKNLLLETRIINKMGLNGDCGHLEMTSPDILFLLSNKHVYEAAVLIFIEIIFSNYSSLQIEYIE